jgi:hypothetical protein
MAEDEKAAAEKAAAEKAAAEKAAAEGAEGDGDGENFKAEAEKWKALSRKHEGQAKANAAAARRLQEIEDANKSDIEKANAAVETEKKRAEAAEAKSLRYEVALEKSIPPKLMKFLTGTTQEEIEQSADELLEAVKPDTGANDTGKPKEKLRAGASSDAEPVEMDPAKIAADIPRM